MHATARPLQTLLAATLMCACSVTLASDDAEAETSISANSSATPMPQGLRGKVDVLAAPRYTRSDPALANLATVPAPAGQTARGELSEISRRWWLSNDRADVGVGLGTVAYSAPASDLRTDGQTLRNAVPALSVGMRYRVSPESAVYADASNARGLYGKGSDAYSAKVGVEWHGEPRPGWGFIQGGIGLRMDSGKIMTMRVKGGGLGVYLRSKF